MEQPGAYFNHSSYISSRLVNRHVSGFQRLPGLYVGEPPILYIAPVYCEVKLLLHLFNEDDQSLRDGRSNKPASTINYSN